MQIVADENIALVKEAFSSFGSVRTLPGRSIDRKNLADADVLLVRSVTKVDRELLENTGVKFVGTATIGSDHIDKEYLKQNGIAFSDAAGCNSFAVAEYVFSALFYLSALKNFKLKGLSIGIIGAGNIGSKVLSFSEALGMKPLVCDFPLELSGKKKMFPYAGLNEVLGCDILTFHVPLTKVGPYGTYHMLNERNLSLIKSNAILINASRGAVTENAALVHRLSEGDMLSVLDVWENEPSIDPLLLKMVDIGTAHIAGYSLEGKLNGTMMIREALARVFQNCSDFKPDLPDIRDSLVKLPGDQDLESALAELFRASYKIEEDSILLKDSLFLKPAERPGYFDRLRKNYRLRRELSNYVAENVAPEFSDPFEKFRVRTI